MLKYHPDKRSENSKAVVEQADVDGNDTDPAFLAVQTAFETLSDPAKRRAYDSQFDFDDSIPRGDEVIKTHQDFFDLYGPVFKRNAKFSERKPVPELGDDSTPIEEIVAFYEFWHQFESWRDFSKFDEHNVEDADHREERRWMEKQNANARAKKKRAEYKRITNLVERARRCDYRLIEWERSEKERKERERAEREAAKAAKIKADREAKEKAAEDAKKAKQDAKQALKTARKRVRKLTTAANAKVAEEEHLGKEEVDMVCLKLDTAGLQELGTVMEEDGTLAPVKAMYEKLHAEEKAAIKARDEDIRRRTEEVRAREEAARNRPDWGVDELAQLSKMIKKHPGGTHKRWEVIADEVNAGGFGNDRSARECIDMAQQLKTRGAELMKVGDTRVEFERHRATLAKDPAKVAAMESHEDPVAAAEAAYKLQGSASGGAGGTKAADPPAPPSTEWSQQQQAALETALRKFPATMEKNERWKAIAGDVPGKNKKECVQRVKALRAAVLAAKAKK